MDNGERAAEAIARLERENIAAREVAEIAALGGEAYPDLADIPAAIASRDVDYGGR